MCILSTSFLFFLEMELKDTLIELFLFLCLLFKLFASKDMLGLIKGKLDAATASMAKYWGSQIQNEIMDECLQLHGGYGYILDYPISRMYADARVQKIYGGSNEIMKELIARSIDK